MSSPDFRRDLTVSVVALLALAGTVGLLLWSGTPFAHAAPGGHALGSLASVRGFVRRHGAASLVWRDLQEGDRLMAGDSIVTGEGAEALVALDSGGRVRIDESSLVVLEEPERDGGRLTLRRGALVGQGDRAPLDIAAGAAHASLPPGAEAGLSVDAGAVHLESRTGDVTLATGIGDPTALSGPSAVDVDAAGHTGSVRRLPVRVVSPPDGAIFYFPASPAPVAIAWHAPSSMALRIEIARTPGFGRPYLVSDVQSSAFRFEPPGEGRFRWRLVDADGNPVSPEQSFVLALDRPPVAASPASDEVVFAPRGRGVLLAWSAPTDARRFWVEVAATADFARPVIASPAYRHQLLATLPPGDARWFWRVRADESARPSSPWSEPASFRRSQADAAAAPSDLSTELRIDDAP